MSRLTKLRQKPKHVRDNIAFVAAGIATLPVVAYLVFAVHGPKMTNDIVKTNVEKPEFFETFTTQIKEQVATVREAVSTSTPSAAVTPTTIDRGPLDAVPVEAPVRNINTATTSFLATSSAESAYTAPPAVR
jgi:hypothetical protein